ncbi:hypothetical protein CF095_13570 [Clostridium botulinum]
MLNEGKRKIQNEEAKINDNELNEKNIETQIGKYKSLRIRPFSTEKELENEAKSILGAKYPIIIMTLLVIPAIVIITLLGFYFVQTDIEKSLKYTEKLLMCAPLLFASFIVSLAVNEYYKYRINKEISKLRQNEEEQYMVYEHNTPKVKISAFEQLSKLNIDHLNNYYRQTYNQCDKSFKIAKTASNFGYGIIIAAIVLFIVSSKFVSDENTRIVVFAIGSTSGVIIKMISSIYFYLYNKTVREMNKYHNKLYTIQNILVSLELSDKINDVVKKDEIRVEMIRTLLGYRCLENNEEKV